MSEVETVPEDEVTEVIPTPTLENLNAVSPVKFTLVNEYKNGEATVDVEFTYDDKKYQRPVNVCIDADGGYDETATLVRISKVRDGVFNKINNNVI
jgi:hypothetical protein